MPEEGLAVFRLEGSECVCDGGLEFFGSTGGGLAQVGFEFGKSHFDRIEVRAVGGQVLHARSACLDQRFDGGDFMGGQVVQDHDVAREQFWAEHLLEISGKALGVECTFDQKGSHHALRAQACNRRGTAPVAMRHVRNTTLVLRAASVQPRHLRVQSGFIDEDQLFAVQLGLLLPPVFPRGFHVGPLLLGGVQRFFYSSTPFFPAGATSPCGQSGL